MWDDLEEDIFKSEKSDVGDDFSFDDPVFQKAKEIDDWIKKVFLVEGWSEISFRLTGGNKEYPLLDLTDNKLTLNYHKANINKSILDYAKMLAGSSGVVCKIVTQPSVSVVFHA